jgi:hypothetical protein
MPKAAKRNVTVTTSGSAKPVSSKPSPRKLATSAKPEAKPETAKPVLPAPVAAAPATDAAAMPRGLTRDAAGIVRYATNYAQYSDRDSAYLAFFGSVARSHGNSATLRQIHDAGITRSGMPDRKRFNPNYTGSGKATDVGAINRLCKAGYFTRSADGNTITATAQALSNALYRGSKA